MYPMNVTLSRRQAGQIMVEAQLLSNASRRRPTKEDVRRVVERLGCIQLDTIHVVARSQYIIPWSRIGNYDPNWLDELHYPDRELFEYWGHAASLIHASLLPFFLSRMDYRRELYSPDHFDWTAENIELIDLVRRRIRDEGPLTSLAFERPNPDEPVEPWAWYGGKPTNRVFDYLWLTGEVAIRRRINFRREYDLFERVFPEIHEIERPGICEERLALADRALQALGICRPEWLNDYFRTKWGTRNDQPPGPQELLQSLVAAERAIPVEINGLGEAYVSVDQEETLNEVMHGYSATRTTFLSPFDSLVWDRQRAIELFDFDYRIECYTPEPKRIYGYFCLPILRRGRLIGRLDPKIDRKTGGFIVKAFHLEPGVQISGRLVSDIRGTLLSFARWNGATSIRCESAPREIQEAVTGDL
jgi:uncharacterized protein